MSLNNRNWKTVLLIIFTLSSMSLYAQTIHYQDFEAGIGNWSVDNGLWEDGIPSVGPDSVHSGQRCVGTDLDANYPPYANTRLVSPYIILPTISPTEHIKLKFWHWFRIYEDIYAGNDQGYVQISVNAGPWQYITGSIEGWSTAWTQGYVDLSAYADSTVRVAFYFTSNGHYEDNGWYIDDISITVESPTPIFNILEDFESGPGDWSADNGFWEFGIPTVWPDTAHSGQNCIGTILNGNYTAYVHSRLVSPYIILPNLSPGEYIKLKFWYWFRIYEDIYAGNDQGWIQISVDDGPWQTLAGPIEGWSPVWTQGYVDLSAYADSTVRVAFYFISNGYYEDRGWYIDDISVTVGAPVFNNPEDFESGPGDWSADNGFWEFGIPTVWPDTAHSGQNCIGTILNGNYTAYVHSRLVSPYITLDSIPGSFVGLYYWHWFRINEDIYAGNDQGWIQISVDDGPWQTLAGPISGYSPVWTQGYVDLSAYVDSTVRIAFYFISNGYYEDRGWYIDDVRIEGIPETFPLTVSVDDGWNMVSVPGTNLYGMEVDDWWPNHTGTVWGFNGVQYVSKTITTPGEGYWMKNVGAETYEYPTIRTVVHDPIAVTAGWNMRGGYETSVPTSGITTDPPDQQTGTIWGFNGVQYVAATNLVPGYGYWVKVETDCNIIIPDALPQSSGGAEVVDYFREEWRKITITDAVGRSNTLYAINEKVDLDLYELPPLPPEGMFDIRYGSGRIAENLSSGSQTIEMQGVTYPITVKTEGLTLTLQDENGKIINRVLSPGEELTINNSSIDKLVILSGELIENIPTVYSLEQNYPNPFNPSTTIKFSIPKEVQVNLSVFNILGEKVTELKNEVMKTGYYEVKLDASNLASGIYLYRIKAGNFIKTKKMILMK